MLCLLTVKAKPHHSTLTQTVAMGHPVLQLHITLPVIQDLLPDRNTHLVAAVGHGQMAFAGHSPAAATDSQKALPMSPKTIYAMIRRSEIWMVSNKM